MIRQQYSLRRNTRVSLKHARTAGAGALGRFRCFSMDEFPPAPGKRRLDFGTRHTIEMWKAGRGERLKFVAELLVTNEALPTSSGHCNHLVRRTWPKRRIPASKYCVNHFGMWCRRRESNDTRLLILRNLLQTYERQNRTTRCMPASYVQNHVQKI